MVDKPQDETIKDRILSLLGKGYTRIQLIKDFGFADRTVDNAIKEYKEQHGGEGDAAKTGTDSDSKALAIPAKLGVGWI